MKLFIKLMILIVIILTVVGCDKLSLEKDEVQNNETDSLLDLEACLEDAKVCPDGSTVVRIAPDCEFTACPDTEETTCQQNSDCASGLMCIEEVCGKIADLYKIDCDETCKINEVVVLTSDDESYTISLGQGSYTMAGALNWKLLSTPQYCPDSTLVPIKISSKSGGKTISEHVITLEEAEESKPILHALAEESTFTLTIDEVTEECE